MLCLQEIEKEMIDKTLSQALWGDTEVRWEMQPTINNTGDYCVLGVMKLLKWR